MLAGLLLGLGKMLGAADAPLLTSEDILDQEDIERNIRSICLHPTRDNLFYVTAKHEVVEFMAFNSELSISNIWGRKDEGERVSAKPMKIILS